MNRNSSTNESLSGWSGLLLVQYVAPGECFVLDGNPEAGLLMGVGVDRFRGQELEEIWPHARAAGLMGRLFETMRTGKPFEATIGVHKAGSGFRVLNVRGRPISRDRLLLSFQEAVESEAGASQTQLSDEPQIAESR